MGEPQRQPATYADVLAAPDGMTAEILDGELYLSPRPASPHGQAEIQVAFDVMQRFGRGGEPGGWWILIEPELHLGFPVPETVVAAPDLAGWRRSRMPRVPRVAAFTLPPDWICEILSPGLKAVRKDRILKPHVYAACGVTHYWIVDPIAETLEVLRLQGGVYANIQGFVGDTRVRAEPFDAIELDMSAWWLPDDEEPSVSGG